MRCTCAGLPPPTPAYLRRYRARMQDLAHEAVLEHLVNLGVTAAELLPVHHSMPEQFLLERGLTNYWGYNTIGFFAPPRGILGSRAGRAPRRTGR